jgi:Legionella pneumophila major outer membrane protein precursor
MRGTTIWRACLLTIGAVLTPGLAFGQVDQGGPVEYQGYSLPDPQLPLPLFNTHPDLGLFFVEGQYVMLRQTNPIRGQPIATRGFTDEDGSITGSAGIHIGSGVIALDANQVSGPNGYTPGFDVGFGFRFADGSALSIDWLYQTTTRKIAAATLAPPGLDVGSNFSESFISAPVFNFPNNFAGPPDKIGVGDPEAAFGIWNGASIMTLAFDQRFNQAQITYRFPVYETECFRMSGLAGPRITWIWERFQWVTTDLPASGTPNFDTDVAVYNNIVSNVMYGVHAGSSNEWYIGHGFAVQLDLEVALFADSARELASYELGNHFGTTNKRSRREFVVVPEFQGMLGLQWYATEGIQLMVGYNLMVFLNTIASPQPVDFDYGSLTPRYERTTRLFDGIQAGIAFAF